jgi:tetratricopeptide (TPR) repeat protein
VPESALDAFRARHDALGIRLAAPSAAGELDALKSEIGALFKAVDQQIAQLTGLREDVLKLVESWKQLKAAQRAQPGPAAQPAQPAQPSLAPQFIAEKPLVHADHIGASTFIEKGWSKISAGDYGGAEAVLRQALQLSPDDLKAESLLGWAEMLQDRFDEALLCFQKVLAREPQNSLARVNVGYICLKKGVFGEAIEHLSRAIRLDNDKKATLYAHFYLGLVYLERDMFEDAQTFFENTLKLGPNLIEAYYELGRAYWSNNRREDALATWHAGFAANKFNPSGKRCADALKAVEEGGQP